MNFTNRGKRKDLFSRLKNRSEELRAEKRVHNGSLEEYLKKVWKNVLTKDAEKDGDIENNGEKEGFV